MVRQMGQWSTEFGLGIREWVGETWLVSASEYERGQGGIEVVPCFVFEAGQEV